jgi:hypothetical protein
MVVACFEQNAFLFWLEYTSLLNVREHHASKRASSSRNKQQFCFMGKELKHARAMRRPMVGSNAANRDRTLKKV